MYDENLASDCSKIFPYYANSWIINNDLRNLQLIVHLSLGVVYFVLFYSMMTSVYVTSVKHACAMYDIVGLVNLFIEVSSLLSITVFFLLVGID